MPSAPVRAQLRSPTAWRLGEQPEFEPVMLGRRPAGSVVTGDDAAFLQQKPLAKDARRRGAMIALIATSGATRNARKRPEFRLGRPRWATCQASLAGGTVGFSSGRGSRMVRVRRPSAIRSGSPHPRAVATSVCGRASPYPVSEPSAPMTRWQGSTIGTGLAPLAAPTARTALGKRMRRASVPLAHGRSGWNRAERAPDTALKRCAVEQVDVNASSAFSSPAK